MKKNPLKEKMQRGEMAVGTFVNFYAPALVEILGYAGLDYICIDDEHGAFSYSEIEDLVRTAELANIPALVRVNYDPTSIQKALDRGAAGVVVPMVNCKADAEAAVRRAKYPPKGTRGTAYSVRAARFGHDKGIEYLDAADANTLVIVHIETPEAMKNFAEIASVPGVDMIFIGPTDLSVSMGYKAEGANHPEVKKAIADMYRQGKELGIWIGTLANSTEDLARCKAEGVNYAVTVASSQISALFQNMTKAGQALNK
ncbi:MAG: aldolase/citrate lyase family protein [Negativicutes bacterium]|nr:aldolase/citrate lyase family protein [Negativicutes bacterium]